MVPKLETMLNIPEDVIVRQGEDEEDGKAMFFIAKGKCAVNYKGPNKQEHNDYKILKPGDYFGEISLIYDCRRTMTVISKNYSTMAKLSKALFLELL